MKQTFEKKKMFSTPPPKFITESGVRRINPAWKAWDQQKNQQPKVVPQMLNVDTALPVVTSIQQHQTHLPGTGMAFSVETSVEMLQDTDVAASIGRTPQNALIGMSPIFEKYQIPVGLVNKLMGVSDFQFMEWIVDDSSSMNCSTDSFLPNGQPMTRWQEVHKRVAEMWEVLAQVPCPPAFIRFLNRQDVVEIRRRDGENPQVFYARIQQILAGVFSRPPSGSTPARERIAESLARNPGMSTIRYFFGDGQPDGGDVAARAITQMLITRRNPNQNPFTFMSCTDEDDACEWMRECEEAAPYCSEFDDYADEQREVLQDQGKAFAFSYGLFVVCCICAAFNPTDLDALDESAPLTKSTLDNLAGFVCTPQEYQYYFESFLQAGTAKQVRTTLDRLKKDYMPFFKQNFQHFAQAAEAHEIPCVQAYSRAVTELKLRGA